MKIKVSGSKYLLVCKRVFFTVQVTKEISINTNYWQLQPETSTVHQNLCRSNCTLQAGRLKEVHWKWRGQTRSWSKHKAAGGGPALWPPRPHPPSTLSTTLLVTPSPSRPWNQRWLLYVLGPAFILKNQNSQSKDTKVNRAEGTRLRHKRRRGDE